MYCRISGRVQGVFYRASARDEALHLGLRGWVRNRPDGDVELVACGDTAVLEQFEAWLWRGPSQAAVTQVTRSVVEDAGYVDFVVRR